MRGKRVCDIHGVNQQALLQKQAESAAVVQRLYMGVRREP
jgi:hypothetical protein